MFLIFPLNEHERLSYAIRGAKRGMEIDFDGEASLNAKRQEIARIFRHMGKIRCSKNLYSGVGVGYKFNAEVRYEAPFDVNDTFAEVLQWHIGQNSYQFFHV